MPIDPGSLVWLTKIGSFLISLWRFLTRREFLARGHSTFQTHKAIARARNRIVLHAAFYPTYTNTNQYQTALTRALSVPSFGRIEVFLVSPKGPWIGEFVEMLRSGYSLDDFKPELYASQIFFQNLREKYPNKVFLYETEALPSFPMVIIDNAIYVGHYAHSAVPAPNGYWIKVTANVDDLIRLAELQPPAPPERDSLTASYRFVAEYVHVKKKATLL